MTISIILFSTTLIIGLIALFAITARPRQITQRGWVAFPNTSTRNPSLVAREQREAYRASVERSKLW